MNFGKQSAALAMSFMMVAAAGLAQKKPATGAPAVQNNPVATQPAPAATPAPVTPAPAAPARVPTQLTVVPFSPNKQQIAAASKREPGAAEEAGRAAQEGGSVAAGVPGVRGVGSEVAGAAGTLTRVTRLPGLGGLGGAHVDAKKGAANLLREDIQRHLGAGPVIVFYGPDSKASEIQATIEAAAGLPPRVTLLTVNPDDRDNKELKVYRDLLNENSAASDAGYPQIQIFRNGNAARPFAILNVFQVNEQALQKNLNPGAAVPAPANQP